MRKVIIGNLTNCCVVTIGNREEQDGAGGREQGSLRVWSGELEQSWGSPAMYGEESFQRRGT